MKKILIFFLLNTFLFLFSQQQRWNENNTKYKSTLEELGNPLPGKPKLIINFFASKEGSYLFYLNENKAKSASYLSENPTDLYAGIYLEDHGGIIEQITFKDFAGPLSQPKYLLDYCQVADADNNSSPEFYLTYFTQSDGLDAKPLKIIIYTKTGKTFTKSKITAWIPFQPEDKYRIERDKNFEKLPKKIQAKAETMLKQIKL